jgi:phospholipid N-methyltransferase
MGAGPITFLKQTIKDFRNTGALMPSSWFLARGIVKSLPEQIPDDYRVLEVGAGTGAVTEALVRRMNGHGHLDVCELSPEFCEVLRERIAREKRFRRMQSRITLVEGDIRATPRGPRYNAIVSGLPFNNFHPDEVRGFLEHFRTLLKPKGMIVWFEYVAIRRIQSVFVNKARREQLKRIRDVTHEFANGHHHSQEIVAINLPPARVRRLRFG